MKNLKERKEVIEYSIKLNTTNLSPLRSGNISVRDKKTISSDFNDSYFFPEGVIKNPSMPSSTPLTEMFPDLRGDKFVAFSLIEYSITSSLSFKFFI